jgi:MFS family permease
MGASPRPAGASWRAALLPDWVGRNRRRVLAARLAMSACRSIGAVVTALYLAAIGFSAVEIGLLFVGVTLASALMSTGIGVWSDRAGRKPFLVAIPLLAAGAAAVYAEMRAPAALFLCAAIGSFGRGSGAGAGNVGPYQPAESAFVAEDVPTGKRTDAFGRLAFASSLGALGGGLLAGLAHTHPHLTAAAATAAYRPAFLAAAALAALSGVIALGLRESPTPPPAAPAGATSGGRRRRRARSRLRWPRRSWPALWRLWLTNGVNGVAIGMLGPFVSYWLHRRYGASPAEIGVLFALINLGTLVSALSAAGIGRRIGNVRAIVAVRAVTAVLLVPMVAAPTFWVAGAVYFVRMLAQRVGLPLRQSFVQDLADPAERGSVAALANLPAQATMAGSQAFAGYLFEDVGLSVPFELAAVFQLANAVLYGLLFRRAGSPGRGKRAARSQPAPAEPPDRGVRAPAVEAGAGTAPDWSGPNDL